MVDPSQEATSLAASIRAAQSARREKEMTIARIPRDPQDPQKFQTIVEQKQKKEGEAKKTQEQSDTKLSIFDISSQQRKTRPPLTNMANGKNAAATTARGAAPSSAQSSVPLAKGSGEKKAGVVSSDEKGLKGLKGKDTKDTKDTKSTSTLKSSRDEGEELAVHLPQGNVQEKEDSPDGGTKEGGGGHDSSFSSSSSKSSAMHDQLVATAGTTDLAALNRNVPVQAQAPPPSIAPIESVASAGSGAGSASAGRDMQQTINAIVEAMTLLQSSDQTDMKVLLSNPPILAGSTVVLTNYMGDSKKFDVAFYDLKTSSQQFLQQMQAEHGIRQALENKGYVLGMYATNVQPYEPIVSTVTDNRADERRFHDEGREGGEKDQGEA